MTKTQVLGTVDFVSLQLLGGPVIQAIGRETVVKVLPNDSAGILSIVSVTQGKYGAVSVASNGTVIYKPNSKAQTDSFTVTVQDSEGATVVKTIAITGPCLGNDSILHWANRF